MFEKKEEKKKQEVPSAHKQLGYSSLCTIVRIIYKTYWYYILLYISLKDVMILWIILYETHMARVARPTYIYRVL